MGAPPLARTWTASIRSSVPPGWRADWSGYDRLLFDLYSDREGVSTATVRIYDAAGGDAGLGGKRRLLRRQRIRYFSKRAGRTWR